jgi:magnesium chelatase family protein
MHLTARGYRRVLRAARTVADLDGTPQIARAHIAEAPSFRRIAPERR